MHEADLADHAVLVDAHVAATPQPAERGERKIAKEMEGGRKGGRDRERREREQEREQEQVGKERARRRERESEI